MSHRATELKVAVAHAVGEKIDELVVSHHRRRLRKIGQEEALDATDLAYATTAGPPTTGNRVELLVDGSAMLPAVAEALRGAQSHVHLAGWYFSPELDLTRGDDPCCSETCLPISRRASTCVSSAGPGRRCRSSVRVEATYGGWPNG